MTSPRTPLLKYKYIQNLDLQGMLDSEGAQSGSADFVEYMKKQIDDAEKHKAQYADQDKKMPKRRPLYLDDKEALKLAKEKIPQLSDNPEEVKDEKKS